MASFYARWAGEQPRLLLLVVGILILVLVGFFDYSMGANLTLIFFYLAPVSFVAWFSGSRAALLIAFFGGTIWSVADEAALMSSWSTFAPYWNTLMKLGTFLVVGYSLSTLKKAFEHQSHLARTDVLTKAGNRRAFYEIAVAEIARSKRYKRQFTVAYIDVDNFKRVNDRMGHNAGDMILRQIVTTLKRTLRASDTVARLGGDEFAVLMPETPYERAEIALCRIQENLNAEMRAQKWRVTFSIGAITFDNSPDTADELVRLTDNLMYTVKKSGKNSLMHEHSGQTIFAPSAKAV